MTTTETAGAAPKHGAAPDRTADERPVKIETRKLSKLFGPRPERAIEHIRSGGSKQEAQERFGVAIGCFEVDLKIHAGETFVLMGLSGSGKSTLLRLLNRLHEPSSGQVLIDGEDVTKLNKQELLRVRREKFSGMVFQQFAILPHRTVLDNVGYGLEVQGASRSELRERSMRAIELVGLNGWENNLPAQLSGGMQQRVGLARALAVDADVLLMDEAFSALDPLIRREMQDELLELQSRMGKTIVFVTHDLDEALRLGDRIAIMKDGEVVQVGTAEEIITKPSDAYVEAFVEGIDRTEVLTASSIMQPVKETAHVRDGPRTVLTKIRRYGLSGILVVDSDRTLKGFLPAEAVIEQLEDDAASRDRIEEKRIVPASSVQTTIALQEVIAHSTDATGPIAVVDDAGKLRGVIVKGAILAALVRGGEAAVADRPGRAVGGEGAHDGAAAGEGAS